MHTMPMRLRIQTLVILNNHQPRYQRQQPHLIERRVIVRATDLLGLGVGWLLDEDGLRDEEDAGGVEELRRSIVSVLSSVNNKNPREKEEH